MLIGSTPLIQVLRHVVNTVAQTVDYGWSDEFSKEETSQALKVVRDKIIAEVDFTELAESELQELGFSKWSDEELPGVYLIPLYLYPCIPDGTVLTCIDGKEYTKGVHAIDNDIRFGCIAYGIKVGG